MFFYSWQIHTQDYQTEPQSVHPWHHTVFTLEGSYAAIEYCEYMIILCIKRLSCLKTQKCMKPLSGEQLL